VVYWESIVLSLAGRLGCWTLLELEEGDSSASIEGLSASVTVVGSYSREVAVPTITAAC
jgi:hypothetical protein